MDNDWSHDDSVWRRRRCEGRVAMRRERLHRFAGEVCRVERALMVYKFQFNRSSVVL